MDTKHLRHTLPKRLAAYGLRPERSISFGGVDNRLHRAINCDRSREFAYRALVERESHLLWRCTVNYLAAWAVRQWSGYARAGMRFLVRCGFFGGLMSTISIFTRPPKAPASLRNVSIDGT